MDSLKSVLEVVAHVTPGIETSYRAPITAEMLLAHDLHLPALS